MVEYSPGMRVIIRDEEWMVKKVERNNLDNAKFAKIHIRQKILCQDFLLLDRQHADFPLFIFRIDNFNRIHSS